MANKTKSNGFREDEIVVLKHWDKRDSKWVESVYPKVGGRLRLAHEDNEVLSISTDIVQYTEQIAVVKALVNTKKGEFSGFGMASVERDKTIAPAILELAETRSIARALRFAGYGVEYCGAEEVSHLGESTEEPPNQRSAGNNGSNGNGHGSNGTNGENGRITNRQLNYIVNLGKERGLNSKDLDQEALSNFGIKLAHLSIKEASEFIASLNGQSN